MSSPGLSKLKNVSLEDQKMIEDIEAMMGPEPSQMGFVKNLFWGRFRDDLVFPYPQESEEERAKCDALLEKLGAYLEEEHPSIQIDQEERIPEWCIDRLFELGVMGMTVPEQYGGLGLGVTSYNRALELIGRHCSSTAVVVSAHQSIGCKAIMLFGTDEKKSGSCPRWPASTSRPSASPSPKSAATRRGRRRGACGMRTSSATSSTGRRSGRRRARSRACSP